MPESGFRILLVLLIFGAPGRAAAQPQGGAISVPPVRAMKNQRFERERHLAQSLDLGDSFQTPKGNRALRRLMGAVAVQVSDPADRDRVLAELTGPGKPLAGYRIDVNRG